MKYKTICFLMPFYKGDYPVGGLKIVLQYANRLAKDGHKVKIVYPYTVRYNAQLSFYQRLRNIKTYYANRKVEWRNSDNWFNKNAGVEEIEVYSLGYKHVPKADIYIATGVETSDYVKDYPVKDKYYFIQGYEDWGRSTSELLKTYHYPLSKIAISTWLQKIVMKEREKCSLVTNGFELDKFYVTIPPQERCKTNICMLYHTQNLKNSLLGFRALEIVHQKYPSLTVSLFGAPKNPENLPIWYHYKQQPSSEELLDIYNNAAIFVGTSNIEGWGLTVGEAMLCGEAVACTDIDGYKEMANHNSNALLSPVGDAEQLAKNIIRLIENDELRIQLAHRAAEDIKRFSIEKSYQDFKKVLKL